jgi:hypothetical protein
MCSISHGLASVMNRFHDLMNITDEGQERDFQDRKRESHVTILPMTKDTLDQR